MNMMVEHLILTDEKNTSRESRYGNSPQLFGGLITWPCCHGNCRHRGAHVTRCRAPRATLSTRTRTPSATIAIFEDLRDKNEQLLNIYHQLKNKYLSRDPERAAAKTDKLGRSCVLNKSMISSSQRHTTGL